MREVIDCADKIFRMCLTAGPPSLEILDRGAEVLEDRTVDEFELTTGRKGRDEAWNAIHDQARLAFAFAQRILGALSLVDVRQEHAPAIDVPAGIAKRKSVVLKPKIDAVRPPESLYDRVRAA